MFHSILKQDQILWTVYSIILFGPCLDHIGMPSSTLLAGTLGRTGLKKYSLSAILITNKMIKAQAKQI